MASPPKEFALLDRLCRFTTEALPCDFSYALLWESTEHVYVPASGYGHPPEHWESFRRMRVPPAAVAGLLAGLHGDDIVLVGSEDLPSACLAMLAGTAQALCCALRRDGKVIGVLIAGYRERSVPLTPQLRRMAHGIAQLAALAAERVPDTQHLRLGHPKAEEVATASHELRTPLSVIMGYNDLLLDGTFGPITAEQTEILRRMERSVRQSLELIDTILNHGRSPRRRKQRCTPCARPLAPTTA